MLVPNPSWAMEQISGEQVLFKLHRVVICPMKASKVSPADTAATEAFTGNSDEYISRRQPSFTRSIANKDIHPFRQPPRMKSVTEQWHLAFEFASILRTTSTIANGTLTIVP